MVLKYLIKMKEYLIFSFKKCIDLIETEMGYTLEVTL